MRLRGAFLLLAVLCCVFPPVVAGQQATRPPVENRFAVPFPQTRDPHAWQLWREQVRARIEARRTDIHANAASGGSSGIIETLAGTAPFQQAVNALKTGFGQLQGIAEDSNGNLYVAGCDLGVVLKVDSSSNTTIYAGQPLPTGPAISSGDGGPATAARIPCPDGLVFDTSGNLYVSDLQDAVVRVVNAQTGIIETVAGTAGQRNHTGDGGPATAATLEFPSGMALDGRGNLFIEDNTYIREVNLATGIIQTIAGTATSQCAFSVTHPCPANQVFLETSVGHSTIAAAQNQLYVGLSLMSEGNGAYLNGGIVDINLSTGSMQLVAGGGVSAGTSSSYPAVGTTYNVGGLTADANGNVYFTNILNSAYELSAVDHTAKAIAGSSAIGYSGDGGPAAMAALLNPEAICLSRDGKVDLVDGLRVRSFTPGGDIATVAGNGFANYFGDRGLSTQAGLDDPTGVVSDASGNLYIADYWNNVVRRVDAVTGIISTVAGGGAPDATGDGGPAAQAYLFPSALAIDQANHLYVRDAYAASIRVVDLQSGVISTLAGNFPGQGPIMFDGERTLYAANTTNPVYGYPEIWAVDVTTGASTKIAGDDVIVGSNGDGGPAIDAVLMNVQGLALDGQGNLYVADSVSNDVRSINLTTGIISTIAGSHTDVPPASGYSGDGGPALDAYFRQPTGLAVDGAGNLVVIDTGNGVLRQIDLTTNIISTIAGNHGLPPGFSGDGSAATGATFSYPFGATFDPSGNLWIADGGNDRVRRVVLHPTQLKSALTYSDVSSGGFQWTATYSGLSFGIPPTGMVALSSGGTSLGTGTLAAATDGSGNYIATITSTSNPSGPTVSAQYSGDANYAAETTTITFQQPSYKVSAAPPSLTIQQGSSGSVTFTVTPQNGFNEQVSFVCDTSTLPKGVTCSFTPASVTPDGIHAATTTLTVQTTGSSIAAIDHSKAKPSGWLPRGGAMLALVVLLLPPMRQKVWLTGLTVLLFAVCLGGVSGCGGGGSNSNGSSQNPNVTPPGSYSIHVNSSVGNQQGAAPITVSLTVTG